MGKSIDHQHHYNIIKLNIQDKDLQCSISYQTKYSHLWFANKLYEKA